MRDSLLMKVVIETLPCPECGSPNRVKHDDMLLQIEGRCGNCGKEVVLKSKRIPWVIRTPGRTPTQW